MVRVMNNADDLLKRYKLSDEENTRIFNEELAPSLFDKYTPRENPEIVIVGGQSGSGKTALIAKTKQEDPSKMLITVDEYLPFHPEVDHIIKEHPTQYLSIIGQDAGIWTASCLKKATDESYPFIFEGTLRNTRIFETLTPSVEDGYKLTLKVLAVSGINSLISTSERFEREISLLGTGRLVTVSQHNDGYENLPHTVKTVEDSNLCSVMQVYRRGDDPEEPILVYDSQKEGNVYGSATEAIEHERRLDLERTIPNAINRVNAIRETMLKRGATAREFENFNELEEYVKKVLSDYYAGSPNTIGDDVNLEQKNR